MHVPGLAQVALAVARRCGCDDKRRAAAAVKILARRHGRRTVMLQHGRVGDDVHKVGKAVHDHQLVDADPGRVRHPLHFFHQGRVELFMIAQAGLPERQHFVQRRLLAAGPERIAAQMQPLLGQFADLLGERLAVGIAEFIGGAADLQHAHLAHETRSFRT